MAQIINIAGTTPVEDPEYRYKMPRVVGKVEGRGNGIKTALPNMVDVAASLHRPPGEVTKFFGCELGAQTTYVAETERAIVNGAHDTRVLQDKLSLYIEKFVLCPACKLPETAYKIKHEIIYHNCVACGNREAVDMQHKLCTYILKQHKIEKKEKDKKDKKKDGKDKDAKKEKKEKKEKGGEEEDAEAKAAKKAAKKEKKAKKAAKKDKGSDEEAGGAAEESEEEEDAIEAGPLGSAIRGIREFVSGGKTPKETVSELRAVQTFCALPRNERGFILCAAAFDEKLLEQLPAKAPLLQAFAKDATPYSLIGGLEKFCLVAQPQLAPKFALVLKSLYDSDVLEEDDVLAWHAAGATGFEPETHVPKACDPASRAKFLAAAEPFVTWLKEADSDTEEE